MPIFLVRMSQLKPWAKAFHIEEHQWEEWQNQVPTGESITQWCLENNKISAQDYLGWAQEYYQLPLLKDEFLARPVSHQFWSTIHSVANWSSSMVPLQQWDGVIFIACTEPDLSVKWSFPVQYVLASPEALNRYWNQLHQSESHQEKRQEMPEVSQEEPSDLEDIPEGFHLEEKSPSPEALGDLANLMPEGFSINPSTPQEVETSDPQIESIESDAPEGLQALSEQTSSLTNPPRQVIIPSKPPTPPPQQPTPAAPEAQAEHPSPEAPPAPPTAQPTPSKPAPTLEKSPPKGPHSKLLQRLQEYFDQSMILKLEKNHLIPWEVDENWNLPPNWRQLQVELSEPSVFRIVQRTQLPYHGPVTNSPVNQWFFQQFGQNTLPEHITACPIKGTKGLSMGLILCVGGQKANNPKVLNLVENVTSQVSFGEGFQKAS